MKEGTERLEKLRKRLTTDQIKEADAFVASGGKDTGTPSAGPGPAAVGTPADAPDKPVTTPPKPATPGRKPPAKPARPRNSR
jgi:hypothetical protein